MMPAVPPPGPAALPALPPLPPVKLLVVDDVPENLIAMRALIARPGLQVLTAGGGTEALELLLQHEVALALLDVHMPDMDGFALAELMRGTQRTREVPIIFLTASPMDSGRSFRGYEAGAVDFLHKPVDPRVIVSKVEVFVQLHAQRRELRQHNQALEQLVRLNETMAAVLGHDLRTPLSAVLMGAEVVRRLGGDERVLGAAERIRSSGMRMARMISQLLDFSRLRSGAWQPQLADHDLAAVSRSAIAEVMQAAPEARIELHAQGDLAGHFDADRLAQVFSNLLVNALAHGAPGETVHVRLDGRDAGRLVAEVDNAGSLDPELLPRLFLPFKAPEERRDGLGLGLFIVDQFVRAHGGQVRAASGDGRVRFMWEMPRRAVSGASPVALQGLAAGD